MKRAIRENVERMQGYVPGEQPTDPGIVKLNTNENPYPPPPGVIAALAALDAGSLRRYPDPLCRGLCERLAARHGVQGAGNVIAANGADEILALCTRAFVENDGAVGQFEPSYSLYPVLADIRGVRRRAVALNADFSWPIDDALESVRAEAGCSLFFFTNPNAPTGLRCPVETVRRFCAGFDGVVVVDEAYVDFSRESCEALALELDNVIVARSLSKSFSLAGVRFGYGFGPRPLVEALYKIKDSYNVNAVTQRLVAAALDDTDAVAENVARICATRERLAGALTELGFDVTPSEANFVWAGPAGISAQELFEGLKARRILVRYFPGERTGAYIRITVGTDEDIDRLLDGIRQIMKV